MATIKQQAKSKTIQANVVVAGIISVLPAFGIHIPPEAVDFAPYSPPIRNYLWDTDKYSPVYSALISHFLTVAARLGYTLESGAGYKLKKRGRPRPLIIAV